MKLFCRHKEVKDDTNVIDSTGLFLYSEVTCIKCKKTIKQKGVLVFNGPYRII